MHSHCWVYTDPGRICSHPQWREAKTGINRKIENVPWAPGVSPPHSGLCPWDFPCVTLCFSVYLDWLCGYDVIWSQKDLYVNSMLSVTMNFIFRWLLENPLLNLFEFLSYVYWCFSVQHIHAAPMEAERGWPMSWSCNLKRLWATLRCECWDLYPRPYARPASALNHSAISLTSSYSFCCDQTLKRSYINEEEFILPAGWESPICCGVWSAWGGSVQGRSLK